MKKTALIIIVVIFLLAACTQTKEVSPTLAPTQAPTDTQMLATDTPEPTATEDPPTDTPQPTATPELPTTTPLPEDVMFRDDFEGSLQPGWTWFNEDPARWSFVKDTWLQIMGDDMAFYMAGSFGMINFLTRDVPEGEFMITAHIQSNPTEDFQQAAIYIFENQSNYIALNIGFCGPCGGPGFYMETFIDNNPFGDFYKINRSPNDTNVFLRLVNQAGSVFGYYAITPGEWQRVGAFGNYFDFKYVGLGTTNSNAEGVENDIVSRFDYFEIALP